MKNSLRFVSAILAAFFFCTAFSACASEMKPPATDVTADITTDAPLTITPVTTEEPETTDAPITETIEIPTSDTSTEGVGITDVPTSAQSTTATPATDAPSVTTEAPVTKDATSSEALDTPDILEGFIARIKTAKLISSYPPAGQTTPSLDLSIEEQDKLLASMYYKDELGYVHIKGSENIRLPSSGKTVSLRQPNNAGATLNMFVYDELCTTISAPDIPVYSAGGTNGTNSVLDKDGKLWFSFDNGETLIQFPEDVCELYFDDQITVNLDYWYAEGKTACAVLVVPNKDSEFAVIITTTDKGNSINTAVYDVSFGDDTYNGCTGISFISPTEGYLVFVKSYWSIGRFSFFALKTFDGGNSFVRIEGDLFGKNNVFLGKDTYVYVSQNITYPCIAKASLATNSHISPTKIWEPDSEILRAYQYAYTPFFDGEIGVLAVGILYDPNKKPLVNAFSKTDDYIVGYFYYISTDYGNTWSLFDSSIIE